MNEPIREHLALNTDRQYYEWIYPTTIRVGGSFRDSFSIKPLYSLLFELLYLLYLILIFCRCKMDE